MNYNCCQRNGLPLPSGLHFIGIVCALIFYLVIDKVLVLKINLDTFSIKNKFKYVVKSVVNSTKTYYSINL